MKIQKALKRHPCYWCNQPIEVDTEYVFVGSSIRYHKACWDAKEEGKSAQYHKNREQNGDPVRNLAYKFVTQILGVPFSWNTHKRYLAEAKFYTNPRKDPVTGEAQRSFTADQVLGCLKAMREGYFGTPILNITTIHVVTWKNSRTGRTFLEDWLEIPPLPPVYQRMQLQDWIKQYGDRAVEQDVMTAGELEALRSVAFGG